MTEKTSKNVLNGQFVMTLGYLWFKIEIRGQKATWIFLADFCSRLKKTMVKFFVWTFRDQSNTKNSSNDLHFQCWSIHIVQKLKIFDRIQNYFLAPKINICKNCNSLGVKIQMRLFGIFFTWRVVLEKYGDIFFLIPIKN